MSVKHPVEPEKPRILVVDDEQSSLNAIHRTLRRTFSVTMALTGQAALAALQKESFSVILADQRMPNMSGVELFQKSIAIQPDAVRVLITGYTDVDAIIQAVNDGQIFYYLHKPWEPEELGLIMNRAFEQYRLKQENQRLILELEQKNQRLSTENNLLQENLASQFQFDQIIGESPEMKGVFKLMRKIVALPVTVLLKGETGTGKEVIARAIHFNSDRNQKPFIAQNCGALPDTLLESQLFGHVKGAFTGASADKKGIFELAHEGTVFLDEIADTSPAMQQRLLRVLQEGEINPVGSEETRIVDVRVIAAANRSLEEEIEEGRFRRDLFFRLNVFPISIPPLRDRKSDIPLLAQFFLDKYARRMGRTGLSLSAESEHLLMHHHYSGNVRELENLIQRAVVLADDEEIISPDFFTIEGNITPAVSNSNILKEGVTLKQRVEELEIQCIQQSLENSGGNISRSAEELGLSRLGLHKKLQRYEIDPQKYKSR